ncbi:unnamed protein product [Periconia digitata]|uniref:Uncharacterized protein n=1 Tax=Periconia digitata TaxID=1303443 RepID=A0A9W4XMI5_9PLEO|nr:unnamed protein product [Periconia digitata]
MQTPMNIRQAQNVGERITRGGGPIVSSEARYRSLSVYMEGLASQVAWEKNQMNAQFQNLEVENQQLRLAFSRNKQKCDQEIAKLRAVVTSLKRENRRLQGIIASKEDLDTDMECAAALVSMADECVQKSIEQ